MTAPITLTGSGTLLKLGTATVAQRVSIDGPEIAVEAIPTSNLDTTGGKTFRPSLIYDPGTLSLTVQYNPKDTTHQSVLALMVPTPTAGNWTLQFTDGSTYAFSGFPTKWKVTSVELEENIEADVEIQISGNIVITPGT
jgi:hypothetical protein